MHTSGFRGRTVLAVYYLAWWRKQHSPLDLGIYFICIQQLPKQHHLCTYVLDKPLSDIICEKNWNAAWP
jgi:hypothetical protein